MSEKIVKENIKKKKKCWKIPNINKVGINRQTLLQQFGTGLVCNCTSPQG